MASTISDGKVFRILGLVHQFGEQIPFHLLLKQINETHRKGLEIDEDE